MEEWQIWQEWEEAVTMDKMHFGNSQETNTNVKKTTIKTNKNDKTKTFSFASVTLFGGVHQSTNTNSMQDCICFKNKNHTL